MFSFSTTCPFITSPGHTVLFCILTSLMNGGSALRLSFRSLIEKYIISSLPVMYIMESLKSINPLLLNISSLFPLPTLYERSVLLAGVKRPTCPLLKLNHKSPLLSFSISVIQFSFSSRGLLTCIKSSISGE